MQAVIVVGIPGAGKSTIVDRVAKLCKEYKLVNVGDMMLEVGKKKGYLTENDNHDTMRGRSDDERKELIREVFNEIAKMKGDVIVDTHASISKHGRFMPGLPGDVISGIKGSLKGVICIDAPTENIIIRREKDTTRQREVDSIEMIDMQRMINISEVSAISQAYNVPLYVLFNQENMQEESVARFKRYVDNAFKGLPNEKRA
jgi:adenylate kinase